MRGDVALRPARFRWMGSEVRGGMGMRQLAPARSVRLARSAGDGQSSRRVCVIQACGASGAAPAGVSRTERRAWTTRGIKRWPGLPPEDAIGKAGSGCFPDLPATGYCQTLRGTERSPQKSVTNAARRHPECLPAGPAGLATCRSDARSGRSAGRAVRSASDSDAIVNGNRSHYKGRFCRWPVFLCGGTA